MKELLKDNMVGYMRISFIHFLFFLFMDNLSLVPNAPPTLRHKLSGKYKGMFGISLSANYRMIIKPLNGDDDLMSITMIEIIDKLEPHTR